MSEQQVLYVINERIKEIKEKLENNFSYAKDHYYQGYLDALEYVQRYITDE